MQVARIEARRKDASRLRRDVKALCKRALTEGAQDARPVSCRGLRYRDPDKKALIVSAERKSIHWPVPLYPIDSLQEAFRRYRWALVFRVDAGTSSGRRSPAAASSGDARRAAHETVYRIAGTLESACFYMGYHLALGLAAGNCRDVYCSGERRCWAMIKGRKCLYPYKARPSLEACGLDPDEVAGKVKWTPGKGPPFLMGMVFVD